MFEALAPPTPDGDLVVEVECRTSRTAKKGTLHPITIRADWSVEVPHDLDAERIAVALGGYCSCLELADKVVPAVALFAQRVTRRGPAGIGHVRGRGWMVSEPNRLCGCARQWFTAAHVAAEHARSLRHLAAVHGLAEWQLERLARAVEDAWGPLRKPPPEGWYAAGLVREPFGLDELWLAGVHPDTVARDVALVPGCTEPLPAWFYLGVEFHRPDRDWLAATLAHCPDPDVATWLAWSDEASEATSDACGRWLELGLRRSDLEVLLSARVPLELAHDVADRTRRTPTQAARLLAAWAKARCLPTAAHVALLDRCGLGSTYQPSGPAVDLLATALAGVEDRPDRTELAVMLALLGGRGLVIDAVVLGTRTAAELVEGSPQQTTPIETPRETPTREAG
jgi:hypothetical protein